MKPVALVTLGRLPKALDIVEALSRAGWRVIVAEPSAWHLTRVSRFCSKTYAVVSPNQNQARYLNELLEIIEREKVELVVPVSEEALHASLIGERLPAGVRLYSMPQERLLELHDKHRFIRLAASLGLGVPETHLLGSREAAALAERQKHVCKPVHTCSGQGLRICAAGTALPSAGDLPKTVVQAFVEGDLKSSFTIAHEGRVIGTIVYRAAILSGTVAVAFERLDDEAPIREWVAGFVGETGHSGFISFDFVVPRSGRPLAIECNPRATSGIHFIDRADLAAAIVAPHGQDGLAVRPPKLFQQFFPALTEVQSAALRRDGFAEKFRVLRKAKDVNFAWSDPLPLWLMPVTAFGIMKRSFLNGESFGEASTHDIAWFGASDEV